MTFRDDHEAALARAEALAGDVEQLERERDALREERDALKKRVPPEPEPPRPPKPPKASKPTEPSPPGSRRRLIGPVAMGLLVCGAVVWIALRDRDRGNARDDYRAKVAERERARARWGALIHAEPCVRGAELDFARTHEMGPASWTTENAHEVSGMLRWLVSNCLDGPRWLAEDASLPLAARQALGAWLKTDAALALPVKRLQAYFSGGDWREDSFAGARRMWAELEPRLAARNQALRAVREEAFPALRAAMRDRQRAHQELHGRDETWWRIELGLQIWDLNETSFEAGGVTQGKPMDKQAALAALKEPMQRFREAATLAPIEVRRDVRKMDWLSEPIARGDPVRPDALWHLAHYDADLLLHMYASDPPAYPPEPKSPPDFD